MQQLHKYAIRWALLGALCFLINAYSFSQKTIRAEGTATVKIEANMTKEQTKQIAKEKAMINAIEDKFGTYIESKSILNIEDKKSVFSYIGTTKVLGEWVRTLEIKFDENIQQTESGFDNYISCDIVGKIRKPEPKANIDFKLLNLPQIESRTTSFYVDEQLYVYFISPVDGYVSVYTEEGEITRRLLPYSTMEGEYQSGVPVKGDQPYIFFSNLHNYFPDYTVDEMILYTDKQKEYNTVYIIFSEEKFVKPILKTIEIVNDRILPKSISSVKFHEWLSDCKAIMPGFLDVEIGITIEKK